MATAVARPVWHDKGADVEAVAALLEGAREDEGALAFEARPAPKDADTAVLHQAALLVARRRLTERHGEKDRILIQEVAAVDDLVRTANLLVERLREWYALHAPEAVRAEPDAGKLAGLVSQYGDRAGVMAALDMAERTQQSLGTDLDDADMAVLQGFATALDAVHDSWHALERRVTDLMDEVAPNLVKVTGPLIGARLIQHAGSLQRLATWPAGTVQTLGAETALFRHIKEGKKPPKHGVLFQHPQVFQAPPWQRGAVARLLARHAGTAARADAYTGNDLSEYLEKAIAKDMHQAHRRRPPKRGPPGRHGGQGPGPKWGGKGGHQGGPKGRGPGKGPGGKGKGPGGKGGPPGRRGAGPHGSKPYKGKPKGKKRDYGGGPAKPPGGGR